MSPQPAPATERPEFVTVPGVVECVETVCCEFGGIPRWIRGRDSPARDADGLPPKRNKVMGMCFDATHPLVQARPELFTELVLRLEQLD